MLSASSAHPPSLVRVQAACRPGKSAAYALLSLPLYLVEVLPRLLDALG